jgi:hypothetical protein
MPLGNYAQQYSAPQVGNAVQDCSPEVLASRRKCKTSAQPGNQQYQEQDREHTQAVSHRNPKSVDLTKNLVYAARL